MFEKLMILTEHGVDGRRRLSRPAGFCARVDSRIDRLGLGDDEVKAPWCRSCDREPRSELGPDDPRPVIQRADDVGEVLELPGDRCTGVRAARQSHRVADENRAVLRHHRQSTKHAWTQHKIEILLEQFEADDEISSQSMMISTVNIVKNRLR